MNLIERIQSFKNTKKFKKLPIEYALAGFILTNENKGILTCTFCNKSLAGWNEEIPYEEHKLHPNNCPLLSLQIIKKREETFFNEKLKFLAKKFFCYKIYDYDTIFCYRCGFYEHFPNENNLGLSSKLKNINLLEHNCPKSKKTFYKSFFFQIKFIENMLLQKPKKIESFDFNQMKEITHLLQFISLNKIGKNIPLKEVLKMAMKEFLKQLKEKMLKDEEQIKEEE